MSDARPDGQPASGRALLVLAAVAVAAAVALTAAAVWPSGVGDTQVLDATPATAVTTPPTIPTVPAPDPTSSTVDEGGGPATTDDVDGASGESGSTDRTDGSGAPSGTDDADGGAATTEPEIALSPLADLLGVPGSAIPPAIEPRVRPASVTIDDLELWGPVRDVGLEADGQLEVPDETEIGWYRYGSSPGRPGATVLAAHVTWNQTIGPFFRLRDLDPGALVEVRLDDDTVRTYEVVERTMYDKDSLPRDRIWRTTGDETLVLITCGGSFNPDINRYRQNIVVYAVPVATSAPTIAG